jgi:ribosomal protein S27AE
VSWKYDASEEERAAEALLREKGWHIAEPQCPLCHGLGALSTVEATDLATGVVTLHEVAGSYGTRDHRRCPNGCPGLAQFMAGVTDRLFQQRSVTADGTVGMRRGVS